MKLRIHNIQGKKERLFNVNELLILAILLMSFMNLYLYTLHLMVLAFVIFAFLKGRLSIPNGIFPPLLLSVSMVLFWHEGILSLSAWMNRIVWPAAFLLGYNLVQPDAWDAESAQKTERKVQTSFIIAAVGFFVHLMLNMAINLGQETATRNTIDIWTEESLAATVQGGLFCVPMAWCIAYIVEEARIIRKIPALLGVAIMLYYNLSLGSRTVIMIVAIIFCLAIIYHLSAGKSIAKKAQVLFAVVGIGLVLAVVYSMDIGGIRSIVEESQLFGRMDESGSVQIAKDVRWSTKLKFLGLMPQYLFGGNNIYKEVGMYAHDILLDTYDQASVFALLAIVAMLWDSIAKLLWVLRSQHLKYGLKITILCLYTSIYIYFAVEPILDGMPWLLMTFCFFNGMLTWLVRNNCAISKSSAC